MKDYFKIVAAMLIWSTWGVMIRWMDLPPVVILFYSALIAGIAVPVILKIRGKLDLSGVFSVWPLFAALALASIVNNLTYFYSLAHTTVSNAVFTHYTAPVLVAFLAPFLIGERIQRITVISLPVAVAGMTLIVWSGGGLLFAGKHFDGILAGTTSGIAYAILIILSRDLSRRQMHYKAVITLLWITATVTAPVALSTGPPITLQAALLLATAGLLHSTTAPLLYFSALRQVMAQHAAILGYIEPLAAIPLAFLLLSEQPPVTALAGGALILLSGYLVIHSASAQSARP